MGLSRRTFLQQVRLALLTLGLSEIGLSSLGGDRLTSPWLDRYFQTLAQPNTRKLALLVGINQYPQSKSLSGCVTDVELQKELLIGRFGFKSDDILTLTNQQATRDGIETAFIKHLSEQAADGDVVFFHFSGYGSQLKIPQSQEAQPSERLMKSLVPVNGVLQTKGKLVVNDLLEETLVLLVRSLATDKVTMVLDTSFRGTDQILQGNLRVRSYPNRSADQPGAEELAFQEQLRQQIHSSAQRLKQLKSLEQMRGIVLAAANQSQLATEVDWNGFSAGLFTYALTQYLWQAIPASTVMISLSRSAAMVERLMGKQQQPQLYRGKKGL